MIKPAVDIIEDIQEKIILSLDKLNNINQVFDYVKLIMEVLEEQPIPGKTKKEFALKILRNIMENSDLGEKQKADCIALIDNNVISSAIDIIISAASGEMEINMPSAVAACSNFIIPCGISILSKKQK